MRKPVSIACALALCISFCLPNAQALAAFSSGAASDAKAEPSEPASQVQPGQVDGRYYYKTVEEMAEQAERGEIVEMVEQLPKTDEEAAAEAAEAGTGEGRALATASSLPRKLDLRDRGVVSGVKDQGSWGTCWAFAANAAAEISLSSAIAQKTGATPTALDFSSLQTAWFGYTPLSEDASTLFGTAVSQAGEGASPKEGMHTLDLGGSVFLAASEFAQGIGVSWLSDTPYQNSEGNRRRAGDWSVPDEKRNYSIARMTKMNYLDLLHTSGTGIDESVLAATKAELNAGRGLAVAYYYDENYLNTQNWCQYNNSTSDTNHLVCIVGYDDDYPASNFNEGCQPSANGAFIVKNSWGSISSEGEDCYDWGIDGSGYFYLSYYDRSIYRPCSFEFDLDSYTGETIDAAAETIDQYDYLQARDRFPVTLSENGGDGWYSNVYTASRKQSIHHVGTYYLGSDYTLRYRVYKLEDDATSPDDYESDVPAAEGTYSADSEGYVSIALDEDVQVKKGGKYAVWFSQSDADGRCLAPYGGNVGETAVEDGARFNWQAKSVVNDGESFYTSSLENAWRPQDDKSDEEYVYDNYCVKACASALPATSDVSFDTRGGSAVGSLTGVADGSTISAPASAPTKAGCSFAGWYKDAACTKAWDFATDVVEEDITLYAKWIAAADAWKRLSGNTAIGTMKAIVNEGWDTSDWAIVATTSGYYDALSASGLAGLLDCPIMLASDRLSNATLTLIKSKQVKNVIVVGGTSAVSDDMFNQIKALGVNVERVAGNTAIGTANAIYERGKTLYASGKIKSGWSGDAIVATAGGYQDALSIASFAYAKKAPIFLGRGSSKTPATLSDSTLAKMRAGKFTRTIITGGTAAVASSVDKQVPGNAKRLGGNTAYGTSRKIADFCISEGMEASHMGVATGKSYYDALAGAALCGKMNSVIILADEGHLGNIDNVVGKNKAKLQESCYIFGGTSAISANVEKAIRDASE